jgi:hypothetical protein
LAARAQVAKEALAPLEQVASEFRRFTQSASDAMSSVLTLLFELDDE